MNRRFFFIGILLMLATTVPAQTNLYVAADGSAMFSSVQAAIMAVPSGSRENPVVIHIKPGTYQELIYVQREKAFSGSSVTIPPTRFSRSIFTPA
jgi:pectin methylesterase-like acyl-CoA thioesterase